MNHYAKWPQKCEAAFNAATSKATVAPTWEATLAGACEVLDNWWSESGMPDITARGKEVARMLLRNSNGKREVAALSETEMAALCRVSEETVRRKLRELERKQVIEKTIRAGRNVYLLSLRLVPDYFPCPPSVRRTEPKGPLFGNNTALQFPHPGRDNRSEVPGSDSENRSEMLDSDRVHKENARTVGGGGLNGTQNRTPPPTGFRPRVGNLETELILRTLRKYTGEAHEGSAVSLAKGCYKRHPNCTTAQVCDKIHLKGSSLLEQRDAGKFTGSICAVLITQVPFFFSEIDQRLDLEDLQRKTELRGQREHEADEEQRRISQREQRESQMQQAAEDAFFQLPVDEQSALREETKRQFLKEHSYARSWRTEELEKHVDRAVSRDWLRDWQVRQCHDDEKAV